MNARDLLDLVWIVPALPLAGTAILLVFGKRIGEPKAGWLATGLMTFAFAWSVVMFLALLDLPGHERTHVRTIFDWFASGGFQVKMGFLADPLSVTWMLFVTGVGTLIHLYSIGYMHGDERFSRFFAYLNLFCASMLILVLGSSFLVTFLGWEGVGLCSYLLISFWFERDSAAVAGKKAFVTTRVGDFGFMVAMFLIFSKLGTLDYAAMGPGVKTLSSGTVTAIALLLFLGAVGKSSQFPLHVWLPDAMEGPTPVSALIHAATMVTSGIFLVSRAHVFFDASSAASTTVAWIGAGTALLAGTVALVQNDIKRVLAYSTISQLGFMFLACGVGAYSAGVFLVVVHAFFKAALFLGAGTVIHGSHDNQDIRTMGGYRRYLPVTAGAFVLAWLAIAGVPPFSGFWAKDEVIASAFYQHEYALWIVGVVAALLTALYMTRETWLVFFGNERFREQPDLQSHEPAHDARGVAVADTPTVSYGEPPHSPDLHGDPHEGSPTMLFPVLALAALAAVGGLLSLPFRGFELLHDWLEPALEGAPKVEASSFLQGASLSALSVVVALVGIAIAIVFYRRGLERPERDPLDERLGVVGRVFGHAYYFDEAIASLVRGPVMTGAGWLSRAFDAGVIDGAVNGIGRFFRAAGDRARELQTGLVRQYALGVVLGAALLLVYVLERGL